MINESEHEAIIDTGSVDNYIPEHIAYENQLNIERKSNPKKIEMAKGAIVMITHDAMIEFNLYNDKNIMYISSHNFIKNPNNIFILGMRLLSENDSIINLKENYVKFDNMECEIDKPKDFTFEETSVYEKVKMCKDQKEDKLKNLIQEAKKKNNSIGEISVI
ncbi:hypothetical protein DMUE_3010, partial [Dictyocoela muelleri]